MFPSITFCPFPNNYQTVYNITALSECGITLEQYVHRSKWSVQDIEECADPKLLFENVIWKAEDLIQEVEILFTNSSKMKVFVNEAEFFQTSDRQLDGRCYTFKPSMYMIEMGMVKQKWLLRTGGTKIRVFVNSNGVLRMKRAAETHFLDVPTKTNIFYNVDHNLYTMLDFEGESCNNEKDYQYDKCIINEMEEKSMKVKGYFSHIIFKQLSTSCLETTLV